MNLPEKLEVSGNWHRFKIKTTEPTNDGPEILDPDASCNELELARELVRRYNAHKGLVDRNHKMEDALQMAAGYVAFRGGVECATYKAIEEALKGQHE